MVDLYYALYGNRRPFCLPNPELSAMFKPQKVQSFMSSTDIKDRPSSPWEDIKPLDMDESVVLDLGEAMNLDPPKPDPTILDLDSVEIKIEPEEIKTIKVSSPAHVFKSNGFIINFFFRRK